MYSNELLNHLRLRDILIRLVVIYYVIRSVLLFLYVSYIVTSERCLTKHAHITKPSRPVNEGGSIVSIVAEQCLPTLLPPPRRLPYIRQYCRLLGPAEDQDLPSSLLGHTSHARVQKIVMIATMMVTRSCPIWSPLMPIRFVFTPCCQMRVHWL